MGGKAVLWWLQADKFVAFLLPDLTSPIYEQIQAAVFGISQFIDFGYADDTPFSLAS